MGTNDFTQASVAISALAPSSSAGSAPLSSPTANKNANLHAAKSAKNDEFYTRIEDIENELQHYARHLKNKVVFCNCDDPEWSNFWKHFHAKFDDYGLKRLIATHYAQDTDESAGVLECVDVSRNEDGTPHITKYKLQGDGDFRSPECLELLAQADIVITNPPFSLFREFVALLMEKRKKFLVIGSMNAITYKDLFGHIRDNRLWLGITSPKRFYLPVEGARKPSKEFKQFGNICWFTNLPHKRRNSPMILFRKHLGNEASYPSYDNYAAIEVSRTENIPDDYMGAMGVPISFLSKYNPDQFEILGIDRYIEGNATPNKRFTIGGSEVYARIVIKRKP